MIHVEDGGIFLTEDGGFILMEDYVAATITPAGKVVYPHKWTKGVLQWTTPKAHKVLDLQGIASEEVVGSITFSSVADLKPRSIRSAQKFGTFTATIDMTKVEEMWLFTMAA